MKKNKNELIFSDKELNILINKYLDSENGKYKELQLEFLVKIFDDLISYLNQKIKELDDEICN